MNNIKMNDDDAEMFLRYPEVDVYVFVYRNVIPKSLCKKLREELEVNCDHRYPNRVFNNIGMQARTNCVYADSDITQMDYSSTSIPSMPWSENMAELKYLISSETFNPNSCLVNGYLEPTDYVPLHRDKDLFDGNNTVCTVSIGGSRCFRYKKYKKDLPHQYQLKDDSFMSEEHETIVNEGDVCYMFGNANIYYEHEIRKYRKTKDPFPFDARFSCTFRYIKNGHKPILRTKEDMVEYYK